MKRFVPSSLLLAFLHATTACTTVYQVPRSELLKLNGFEADNRSVFEKMVAKDPTPAPQVLDGDGRLHPIAGDTLWVLDVQTAAGPRRIEQRYQRIHVTPEVFEGEPHGAQTATTVVAMEQLQDAGVRKISWPKTLGLAGGITAALLTGLIVVALSVDTSADNHHEHDRFD